MNASSITNEQLRAESKEDDEEFARRVLRAEADAILYAAGLIDKEFSKAVELLVECAGSVIVCGMGKSGIIAQKFSATLAATGTPSHWLHPTEAMHGDLGRVTGRDIVVLISRSGGTGDVLSLAALVRQDKVPVIAITQTPESLLGRSSDCCLCIGRLEEACPLNLAPTASTTATLALTDALALAASRRRSFSVDDFRKRHPGGSLGRLMMNVVDVMRFRVGENLVPLRDDLTLQAVLQEGNRSNRRSGAVLLLDEKRRLSGIFTDGDLRRYLTAEGASALSRPIRELMSHTPACLDDGQRVQDAVQMVRELRIDEIPVVDGEGRPVGLLDVQDLVALKLIRD